MNESDKIVIYTVVAIMCAVAIVVTIILLSTSSSFYDPKNIDFDFMIEQIFLKKGSDAELKMYKSANALNKLKILEDFKRKNPDSVKIANEMVGFNSSNVIVKDPIVRQIIDQEDSNTACKSIVAKTLSMPLNITVEILPKNIKKFTIYPFVSLNNSGVVVDIEKSIMPTVSKDNDYNKLNSQSKMKIVNILKEKIFNDINSKYKKATVSLSFAKANL